ncbi:hypothetical protein IJT93_00450 [bacterium]|nr:hypothetical protein [bacterium]
MADAVDLMLMAAAREPYRQAAVSHYHALLERRDVKAFAENLQEELKKRGAIFGGRPLCPFLRPHFIGREQYLLMQDAVRGIFRALSVLRPRLLKEEKFKKILGFTEAERELIEVDPGYEEFSVTSRLDSFMLGGILNFVEYNAETPAGMCYADEMIKLFDSTEIMREFKKEFPYQYMLVSDRLLQAILDTYEEWGGTEKPTIAIVDYDGLPTVPEFQLVQKHFQKSGYKCLIADPRNLEYNNGVLSYKGQHIHIVYKRLLINEYFDHADECKAYWEAYKNHAACFVNSFRCKYYHKKAIFAILSDPQYQEGFSDSQIQTIYTHIPWTRMLTDCSTTDPQGGRIELLDWVRRNRSNLVLKPNDDYGGHGIFVGWECDEGAWEAAIEKSLKANYLVQIKVDVAREHYPSWNGSQVEMGEYAVDLDPYIFGGRVAGFMTRLSGTSLCNVTSGGGATATFILD